MNVPNTGMGSNPDISQKYKMRVKKFRSVNYFVSLPVSYVEPPIYCMDFVALFYLPEKSVCPLRENFYIPPCRKTFLTWQEKNKDQQGHHAATT
jgi:hypothetical protein